MKVFQQGTPMAEYDALDRMSRTLRGSNPLPPRSPMGAMADDLGRPAQVPPPPEPPRPAGPGNPNVPPGGSAEARAFQQARAVPPGAAPVTPTAPAALPDTPNTPPRTLRSVAGGVASAVGNGVLYGGAAAGGVATARALRDAGAPKPDPSVMAGERQPGDSTSSTLIPTGGTGPAPAAQPYNFWSDNEVGRNVGNTVNAIAPLGGVAMAARAPGALTRTAGLADAALNGLSGGIHGERSSPAPVQTLRNPQGAASASASDPQAAPQPGGGITRIDRAGHSPLFTDNKDPQMAGFLARPAGGPTKEVDGIMQRMSDKSQNEAFARFQKEADSTQYAAEVRQAQAINQNQAAQRGSWENRVAQWNDPFSGIGKARRNMEVSMSGMTPYHHRGKGGTGEKLAEARQAAYGDLAKQHFGMAAGDRDDATRRHTSDNSLRGSEASAGATRYAADARRGSEQAETQQKLRQQQLMGGIYQAAGGDPVKAAKLAAGYGIDPKQFTEMAGAEQTRAQANSKDARSTFDSVFVDKDGKRDERAEAQAHQLASRVVPGWENMNPEQRNANRAKVVDATRAVQGMNSLRNNGWGQAVGWDAPTPEYSQLPDLNGATVGEVGLWDGATTPKVSSGDTRITLRSGEQRHIPAGTLSEAQLRMLQDNGAMRSTR